MKQLLIILIFFLISTVSFSQLIDSSLFNKLKTEQESGYTYTDKKGNILGCEPLIECDGINIVFYSITFDKNASMLFLKGRTYNPIKKRDSIGKWINDTLPVTGILIAAGKLKNNRVFFYGNSFYSYMRLTESDKNVYPLRRGDFDINVKVKKCAKLFFIGTGRRIEVFDIGKLL